MCALPVHVKYEIHFSEKEKQGVTSRRSGASSKYLNHVPNSICRATCIDFILFFRINSKVKMISKKSMIIPFRVKSFGESLKKIISTISNVTILLKITEKKYNRFLNNKETREFVINWKEYRYNYSIARSAWYNYYHYNHLLYKMKISANNYPFQVKQNQTYLPLYSSSLMTTNMYTRKYTLSFVKYTQRALFAQYNTIRSQAAQIWSSAALKNT